MSPFNKAWVLLKQQNYRQTALPGMAYDPEFDMRYYKPQNTSPQVSHIDYDLNANIFRLRGENDELLSSMYHDSYRPKNQLVPSHVSDIDSVTMDPYKRQGYYGKLLQGMLNAGIGILSNERNSMSQPFHEKFQDNLTPNLDVNVQRNRYDYSRKPIATFGNSDLAQRDYGALPIKIRDDKPRSKNRYKTKQTHLADFDPAFKQWELDDKESKEIARRKQQEEDIRRMVLMMEMLTGKAEKEFVPID